MNTDQQNAIGYFPIARESADISFQRFYEQYYKTEQPVVIENVGSDWPARNKWTSDYLQHALSREPSAKATALWYWLDRGAMEYDYATPEIIENLYRSDECFPRAQNLRIWVHAAGNVSPWHFDTNMVNIFNVQVTGNKEWFLLSPKTPPICYPFSFYAIIDGRGDEIFHDKIHTRVTLNEGDMIYIPPCWFHKVVSCDTENISLNWIMTNRKTVVNSKAMARELEIYTIQDYFKKHRFEWLRKAFDKFYSAIPGILRYRWRYGDLIDTPHSPSGFDLWKRVLKEISALGPTLIHSHKAYAAIRGIKAIKKLEVNRR